MASSSRPSAVGSVASRAARSSSSCVSSGKVSRMEREYSAYSAVEEQTQGESIARARADERALSSSWSAASGRGRTATSIGSVSGPDAITNAGAPARAVSENEPSGAMGTLEVPRVTVTSDRSTVLPAGNLATPAMAVAGAEGSTGESESVQVVRTSAARAIVIAQKIAFRVMIDLLVCPEERCRGERGTSCGRVRGTGVHRGGELVHQQDSPRPAFCQRCKIQHQRLTSEERAGRQDLSNVPAHE
jgi:hypothetical protein